MNETAPLAVITGGSSGLGLAYARQLAKEGYALILVARREELLKQTAQQLEQEFHVPVGIFPADLSLETEIHRLEARLKQCPRLDYMINAAGFGIGGQIYPDHQLDRSSDMLRVHCLAVQRLSCVAAQVMKPLHTGHIINIASVAAYFTSRGNVDYASTKAYIVAFTRGLACDLKGTGIRVQALCPGFVRTGFHATPEMQRDAELYQKLPGFLWLKADWVVRKSLRQLRRHWRRTVYVPSLRYKAITWALRNFFA